MQTGPAATGNGGNMTIWSIWLDCGFWIRG